MSDKHWNLRNVSLNGAAANRLSDISINVMTGVTASQALLDEALAWQADLVLVHHGYFWKNEPAQITGMKRRRLKTLLANDINLAAYHLPLDAHPTLGNNAQLARRLGLHVEGGLEPDNPLSIGNVGRLDEPMSAEDFAAHVELMTHNIPAFENVADMSGLPPIGRNCKR